MHKVEFKGLKIYIVKNWFKEKIWTSIASLEKASTQPYSEYLLWEGKFKFLHLIKKSMCVRMVYAESLCSYIHS